MKLSAWLKQNEMTQREFLVYAVNNCGADFSFHALAKWCNGQRIPRPAEMKIIHHATKGSVQPNDFYALQTEDA